jgi:hypothetical protein
MPRLPGWTWLLLAIGFATLATYMAMGYLKRQAAVRPPAREKIYVVRASTKAGKEKILSLPQLKRVEWNQAKPPQDFFPKLMRWWGGRLRKLWRRMKSLPEKTPKNLYPEWPEGLAPTSGP